MDFSDFGTARLMFSPAWQCRCNCHKASSGHAIWLDIPMLSVRLPVLPRSVNSCKGAEVNCDISGSVFDRALENWEKHGFFKEART
jgi:hypothetical protein